MRFEPAYEGEEQALYKFNILSIGQARGQYAVYALQHIYYLPLHLNVPIKNNMCKKGYCSLIMR